jgi:hydrogenase expression/formation protein HypE
MTREATILLAHGAGGRLTRELIEEEILPRFGDGPLRTLPDGASLPAPAGRVVFTTDSFVVQPIEFPGGNIGHLAVHGTVNDLAVCGATPRWLSLSLILEEGLPLSVLRRILDSVRDASRDGGVTVATGDTKVVARGECDGIYINTAGIGEPLAGFDLGTDGLAAGDAVLVSGTLADHGMAVLTKRHGLNLVNGPASDTAPVHRLVLAIQPHAPDVHFMRDPTRGGLAAVLNELVAGGRLGVLIEEEALPLSSATRAVAELLGLDPLHVASEGRLVLVCAPEAANPILDAWRSMPEGRNAAAVGRVEGGEGLCGRVVMRTVTGGRRLVDVPRGELLPRIC